MIKPLFTPQQMEALARFDAEHARLLRSQVEAAQTFLEQMVEALEPMLRRFGAALQEFDAAAHQNYLAAGVPYGDTLEGRWRWMNELAEAHADIRRELMVVEREQDLAEIQQLGAKILAHSCPAARGLEEQR